MKLGVSFKKERATILAAVAAVAKQLDAANTKLDTLLGIESAPIKRATVTLRFGHQSISFNYTSGDKIMATVADSGGPFNADISAFVDAASNPVTDTDVPVWAAADSTVATVTASTDTADPQGGVVTLTKKLGNTDITATFPGGFVVTGNLNVIAGAAVGATMTFTGPGIVPGA
jgi:hypothetical protein